MDLTRREDEVGIRDSARLLGEYIGREVAGGIGSEHIVLAGFSQGGAIALFAGLRYPQPLAGILALSTYLPLPVTLRTEAHPANANIPVLMAHGTADPVIATLQGEPSASLLRACGYHVEWRTYPMAHAVCAEEIGAIAAWLRECLTARSPT
ncbi:MAG: alpha/beta hydrolase [Chromatiales bacterium]